jgi:hypothetical protein
MEYNTVRTRMLMPEYGRNVQSMAEYLLTIEDREKRLKNAEAVIELMGILNPHLKLIEDYKHKLWDHLHQMTDFRLDVDAPYPKPTAEEVRRKPQVIPYPQVKIKHRHLGRNLESLIQKGLEEKEEEKKQGFTQHVGYYMKLAYGNWHKEPVHDDMIKSELNQLTKGQMQYEAGGFKVHFDPRAQGNGQQGGNKNFKNSKNFKQNNNNRNFNNSNSANISGAGTIAPAKNNNNYNKNRKFNNKNKNSQG